MGETGHDPRRHFTNSDGWVDMHIFNSNFIHPLPRRPWASVFDCLERRSALSFYCSLLLFLSPRRAA